ESHGKLPKPPKLRKPPRPRKHPGNPWPQHHHNRPSARDRLGRRRKDEKGERPWLLSPLRKSCATPRITNGSPSAPRASCGSASRSTPRTSSATSCSSTCPRPDPP